MAEVVLTQSAMTQDSDLSGTLQSQRDKKKGLRPTLTLAVAAIGVIFGDIGTSPLYVFSSTFQEGIPDQDTLFGATSLIFWTLTVIVILKYCLLVLQADDNGEGGTFALYSLICRFCNIAPGNFANPSPSDTMLTRYSSAQDPISKPTRSSWAGPKVRSLLEQSSSARNLLLFVVLLMTSLVLGDAILTPAQSVLGAIYGLQVKKPEVTQGTIVGVSCAIIFLIFAFQRLGTMKLGSSFAPIVLLWFFFNLITAIYNIASYQPGIFKCFSPHYIYLYFKHQRHTGWKMLAGIFLAVTGSEATFADLGHFSRASIRLAFIGIAYPCLILTYFGQAAFLTAHPELVSSTFYSSIPFGDGFYWVFFAVATAAACVASQTMISAAFSLLRQSMSLGCFPRLTVQHTSAKVEGQVYIPEINWLMMVLTIIVVAIFKTTTQLGNAYGVAVSGMMFGTTCLIAVVMMAVWDAPLIAALAAFVLFGFVDMVYLSANLHKVPDGGWLTIAIAGGVCLFSHIWHHGMWIKHSYEAKDEKKLADYFQLPAEAADGDYPPQDAELVLAESGKPLLRTPGLALFYTEGVFGVPPSLLTHMSRLHSLPQAVIILSVRPIAVPEVGVAERLLIAPTVYPGVLRVVARYGYHESVCHDAQFVASILKQAMTVPGMMKYSPPVDKALFVVTNPHLEVQNAWSPRKIWDSLLINAAYNPMVRHLARRPWENWNIQPGGLCETHYIFNL